MGFNGWHQSKSVIRRAMALREETFELKPMITTVWRRGGENGPFLEQSMAWSLDGLAFTRAPEESPFPEPRHLGDRLIVTVRRYPDEG